MWNIKSHQTANSELHFSIAAISMRCPPPADETVPEEIFPSGRNSTGSSKRRNKDDFLEPSKIHWGSEDMPHFITLGIQIAFVMWIGLNFYGYVLYDFHAIALESGALSGIVADESDLGNTQVTKDLGT